MGCYQKQLNESHIYRYISPVNFFVALKEIGCKMTPSATSPHFAQVRILVVSTQPNGEKVIEKQLNTAPFCSEFYEVVERQRCKNNWKKEKKNI